MNIEVPSAQSHLAALLNSTDDAVIGETLEGVVTSWNPAAAKLFEYTAAEMIGRSITVLFPPKLAGEESTLIARIRNGEPVSHYQTQRVSKSGILLDISITLSPIFDQSGQLVGISKIARDLTLEREHYLVLERQCLAAEAGDVGLWNLNTTTRQLEWSDRHKMLFGLTPHSPAPPMEDLFEFVHAEDNSAVRRGFEDVLNGARTLALEYRIVRADGAMRWISTTGKRDHNQVIFGTSIDITERRMNEDALRRANSSLEEFAYAAAHDLQEPLRNISLSLQLLAQMERPEDDRSAMMSVVKNANWMQTLLEDLLDFSRVLNSTETTVELIEAGATLNCVIESLSHTIEEYDARVSVDSDLPAVPMSRCHLFRLFQNLLENALKYRGLNTPVIRISGWQERAMSIFSVADNGLGIAPQYHRRIFEVFKRLDHTKPGNGIGLSICKRIVEHYGGKIWLASEQGHGAVFFFSLPNSRK